MALYRLLLWLYPAGFRAQYGGELAAIFSRKLRAASNPLELLWIWMEALVDVLVNAPQTHWDILCQDVRYSLRMFRRSPGFAVVAIGVAAIRRRRHDRGVHHHGSCSDPSAAIPRRRSGFWMSGRV